MPQKSPLTLRGCPSLTHPPGQIPRAPDPPTPARMQVHTPGSSSQVPIRAYLHTTMTSSHSPVLTAQGSTSFDPQSLRMDYHMATHAPPPPSGLNICALVPDISDVANIPLPVDVSDTPLIRTKPHHLAPGVLVVRSLNCSQRDPCICISIPLLPPHQDAWPRKIWIAQLPSALNLGLSSILRILPQTKWARPPPLSLQLPRWTPTEVWRRHAIFSLQHLHPFPRPAHRTTHVLAHLSLISWLHSRMFFPAVLSQVPLGLYLNRSPHCLLGPPHANLPNWFHLSHIPSPRCPPSQHWIRLHCKTLRDPSVDPRKTIQSPFLMIPIWLSLWLLLGGHLLHPYLRRNLFILRMNFSARSTRQLLNGFLHCS